MTGTAEIIRLAAKGDGVTQDGRHVTGAVPGDTVLPDGTVQPGPHRAVPPCRHFDRCGGCQLQQADEDVLARFVTDRVVYAALGQDMVAGEVLPTHLSPPGSRRRATLRADRRGQVRIGYREARSHTLVEIRECPVLRPELVALLKPLRTLCGKVDGRGPLDIAITWTDRGVDCAIEGGELLGLEAIEAAMDFARDHELARLSVGERGNLLPLWEPQTVTVTLAGVPVDLPVDSFLQATADAEALMAADVREWLDGSERVADLFAGLGTFAFALADRSRVVAAEASRAAHLACRTAANRARLPVDAQHRDLFRNPFQVDELAAFDAVVLDPPRAGAREQCNLLADSVVRRIAYVSCNPSSWARDAARLVEGGYRLEALRPVGQFRWSTHVELTSLFVR
ncbi:class I SAM-dependent RNA methyltransferase [Qipengyuania sp. JC766]|uniref:class I SAM-dependent RNA methyltransferase n=1 Tax=Qipengyuania sp. JC766 TaxID=3232139 RepID=UPI0034580FC2